MILPQKKKKQKKHSAHSLTKIKNLLYANVVYSESFNSWTQDVSYFAGNTVHSYVRWTQQVSTHRTPVKSETAAPNWLRTSRDVTNPAPMYAL